MRHATSSRPLGVLLAFVLSGCGEPATPSALPGPAPAADAVRARATETFVLADWLKPRMDGAADLDPYLAPLVYLEVPASDRASAPSLPGVPRLSSAVLELSTELPSVYFEDGVVTLGNAEHRQLSFVWFRAPVGAERPRAQGLRITFDSSGFPAINEVLTDSSGLALVYVSDSLESAARAAFGEPPPGCEFAAERGATVDGTAVVVRTLADAPAPMGPYLYQPTDSNDVTALHCRCDPTQADEIREVVEYELLPLALLDGLWPATGEPGFGAPDAVVERLRLPGSF